MEQVSMISMTRYDRNIPFIDTPPWEFLLPKAQFPNHLATAMRFSHGVGNAFFSNVAHHGLSSEQLCPLWLAPVQVARLNKKVRLLVFLVFGWVLDVHFRHSQGSNTMYNELKFCDLCNFLVVVVWRNAFRLEVWFSAQTGDSLQVLQFDQELNGLVIFGSACCHPLRDLVQSEGKEFERMHNVWAWMDMFSPYSVNSVDYIMHLQKSDKFQCPWQKSVWPRMNQIIQTANSLLKNLCLHKRRSLRICKQTQPKQFDSLNDIHASTSSTKRDSKWTSDSWWWIISLFIQLVRTECIETTLCSPAPSYRVCLCFDEVCVYPRFVAHLKTRKTCTGILFIIFLQGARLPHPSITGKVWKTMSPQSLISDMAWNMVFLER